MRLVWLAAWLAVIGVLAVALPAGYYSARPGGCIQCHDMAPVREGEAALPTTHEGVECATCHAGNTLAERVQFGYYQAFGMRLPLIDIGDSPVSSVPDATCSGCHGRLDEVSESRGLRVMHEPCSEGARCVSCHSPVAHPDAVRWPTTYSMEGCLECHGARQASRECDTCHMGRIRQLIPSTGTFPITHGPNWERTHGMGEMSTCSTCHDDDFCRPCHGPGVPHPGRFVSVHGVVAKSENSECFSCHMASMCDGCHVYEMPHPLTFTEQHSGIVATDGEQQCRYCHDPQDCITCHDMHVHPGGAGPLGSIRGDAR